MDFPEHMSLKWFILFCFVFVFGISKAEIKGTGPDTPKDTVRPPGIYGHLELLDEKQLIELIDSLYDREQVSCDMIVKLNALLAEKENANPKNDFGSFSVYPADNIYSGKWDTRSLFPYKNELSKYDSTLLLELTGDKNGLYTPPVTGNVTSGFGWRDTAQHQGVDMELRRGDAVSCAFDGMVRVATRNYGGYGNVIIVRHFNGLETLYAHLYKMKVKPGDFVFSGQTIGLGGSTGRSTGAHLHFETRFKGVPINPRYFISFDEHCLISSKVELKKMRWGYAAYATDQDYYIIQKGDNLYELSRQFATTVAKLRELNGFTRYPRLKAGEKLIVRSQDGKF
ncbi:MAG: peptidoglycan DD-metalloendopeptidase family protein [Bacteroidia bacterium]